MQAIVSEHPARAEEIVGACEQLAAACQAAHLDDDVIYRVRLVLDELGANLVNHQLQPDDRFQLDARIDATGVELALTYGGPAFDPTQQAAPDLSIPFDERPTGGLGLHLVRESVERFSYERVGAENRLSILIKPRAAPAPHPHGEAKHGP